MCFKKIILLNITVICGQILLAQAPSALKNGKFINDNKKLMLYGGASKDQNFLIENMELKPEQFHYGLGREAFPALIKPRFESVEEADKHRKPKDRFLVAYSGKEVKAYAIKDLTRHEVANDVLNGEPIFAAYCILADLGAIYTRTYGDKVFTFAVSGYTYYDPEIWNGLDGFILWDRETESLWWPLIDKAVSGRLKNMPLLKLEQTKWEDTNWQSIKNRFPNAEVLISNQDFERPIDWPQYKLVDDLLKIYID